MENSMIDRRWYTIGPFRVLEMPLPTNPAFRTHHVYSGAELIGKQLSVPTEADCRQMIARGLADLSEIELPAISEKRRRSRERGQKRGIANSAAARRK